jgi:MoaA/NifB/PqqE/SkfB family radical SAM enzyme
MLARVAVMAALHRKTGSAALSVFLPILKRLVFLYPSNLPRRVRKDSFAMVHALWSSALRTNIPKKTAELLSHILSTGNDKVQAGVPGFLVISPGKACNLRCPNCYANSPTGKDALDYDTLRRIMHDAKDSWQTRFFVISGGEPFMYRNQGRGILDLAGENQDCLFLVYTNGTLISRTTARRIAELANITPAISVEGMRLRTEQRRGKGTFDRILTAMGNLRDVGVPFGLSLTATRDNAEEIMSDRFIDFFFREQKATYAWVFHYMPMGRNPDPDAMPTPEQRIWLWKRSWQIIRERRIMIADFWNHGTVSQGCISGARPGGYFHIDWNGDVSPCVFFPYACANINAIYRNGLTLNDAIDTPLFHSIRKWQESYGYQQPALTSETDWLRPCPIRDHCKQAFEIIKTCNSRPTDAAPQGALEDPTFLRKMADYDRRLAEATKGIWNREYISS